MRLQRLWRHKHKPVAGRGGSTAPMDQDRLAGAVLGPQGPIAGGEPWAYGGSLYRPAAVRGRPSSDPTRYQSELPASVSVCVRCVCVCVSVSILFRPVCLCVFVDVDPDPSRAPGQGAREGPHGVECNVCCGFILAWLGLSNSLDSSSVGVCSATGATGGMRAPTRSRVGPAHLVDFWEHHAPFVAARPMAAPP